MCVPEVVKGVFYKEKNIIMPLYYYCVYDRSYKSHDCI